MCATGTNTHKQLCWWHFSAL